MRADTHSIWDRVNHEKLLPLELIPTKFGEQTSDLSKGLINLDQE